MRQTYLDTKELLTCSSATIVNEGLESFLLSFLVLLILFVTKNVVAPQSQSNMLMIMFIMFAMAIEHLGLSKC